MTLQNQIAAKADTGDRGGNEINVRPATGEVVNLHAYWDGMFGGYSTVYGAIFDSFAVKRVNGVEKTISKLLPPSPQKGSISDPEIWLSESNQLAHDFAYAEPVLSGQPIVNLTREYETNSRKVSEDQISLAATRLANLINVALN